MAVGREARGGGEGGRAILMLRSPLIRVINGYAVSGVLELQTWLKAWQSSWEFLGSPSCGARCADNLSPL